MANLLYLAEHFSLNELCHTTTGKVNNPSDEYNTVYVITNLSKMAFILEELRRSINDEAIMFYRRPDGSVRGMDDPREIPVHVHSCYRSRVVNMQVGGTLNSRHRLGLAFDISVPGMDADTLRKFFKESTNVKDAIRMCSLQLKYDYSISASSAHFEFSHLEAINLDAPGEERHCSDPSDFDIDIDLV